MLVVAFSSPVHCSTYGYHGWGGGLFYTLVQTNKPHIKSTTDIVWGVAAPRHVLMGYRMNLLISAKIQPHSQQLICELL